eukprot:NODE_31247_length_401_cov_0.861314.p2 GENE.NODE_31247_length_401_cov_0.861314~~NODE_31247_length_401_cov_0.861314.p2  ORF type:complete len:55 (+),score=0.12 NODE_31247_length_401_cov_0.861314:134-298(+)
MFIRDGIFFFFFFFFFLRACGPASYDDGGVAPVAGLYARLTLFTHRTVPTNREG